MGVEGSPRQKFLPSRVVRTLGDLESRTSLAGGGEGLGIIAELVAALYHYDFHARARAVTECWEDAVDGNAAAAAELARRIAELLEDSNYRRITSEQLTAAVSTELLLPLRLEVDLDVYRELLIYHRGSHRDTVLVRRWDRIRRKERRVTVDRRLLVHTQVQSADWFAERGIDPAASGLEPGRIDLRHFRDIPRANIATLLPSARVRYRFVDTLIMGIPAVASGIVVLTTKLLTTLGLIFVLIGAWLGLRDETPRLDQASLVVLIGGLAALGGFCARQYAKLKGRRVEYLKILNEHLFSHTLGDGSEVIFSLLHSAEQQEVTEVLIGYRFLVDRPGGYRAPELDMAVERWLHRASDRSIDFDVDGALAKLLSLHLAVTDHPSPDDDPTFHAVPPDVAHRVLTEAWAQIFDERADPGLVKAEATTGR